MKRLAKHCSSYMGGRAPTVRKLAASVLTSVLVGLTSLPSSAMAGTFSHKVSPYWVLAAGGYYGVSYYCPTGQTAVSGGWESLVDAYYGTGLRVVSSHASSQNGWAWTVVNEGSQLAQVRWTYTCYKP
jgi:hypothetical protein